MDRQPPLFGNDSAIHVLRWIAKIRGAEKFKDAAHLRKILKKQNLRPSGGGCTWCGQFVPPRRRTWCCEGCGLEYLRFVRMGKARRLEAAVAYMEFSDGMSPLQLACFDRIRQVLGLDRDSQETAAAMARVCERLEDASIYARGVERLSPPKESQWKMIK